MQAQTDTLLLPEVEKKIKAIEKDAGTYVFQFDSIDHISSYTSSLADLFRNSSTFNVNANGPGNLNTLSFRGLRSVHTAVLWNGVNINSPSAGLSDLSLINAGLFDQVTIQSDEYPGSSVSLSNEQFKNDKAIIANFGMKSFGGRDYGFTYETGDGQFYSKTHFDISKKENDFPFRNESNSGSLFDRRGHAQVKGWNFQQDIGSRTVFRSKTSTYSGHIWYSKYNRNIANNIQWALDSANQVDRSFKLAIKTKTEDGNFSWSNTFAYMNDLLEYQSPVYDFASNYRTSRGHLNSNFKLDFDPIMVNGGLELRTMSVKSSNYNDIRPETALALWGKAQKRWINSRLVLMMKQEISNIFTVPLSTSLGYDQYYPKSKLWGSVKKIGRAPIYDDLFFKPGGDPNVGSEKGWAYEAGWSWHPLRSNSDRYTVNVYRNEMKNWIQWVPDTSFNFSPTNYKSVTVNGFLLAYKQKYTGGQSDVLTDFSVSYNKAVNNEVLTDAELQEKQLVYSPIWSMNGKIAIVDGSSTFGYRFNYMGRRFTDEQNLNELPSSLVHDLFISTKISQRFILNLEARNVTNKNYFSIANYPMYGINFGFDLIYRSFASMEKEVKSKKPKTVNAKPKKKKKKFKRRRIRRW